jgi:hypothetical protein
MDATIALGYCHTGHFERGRVEMIDNSDELKRTVESLHFCRATLVGSVPVRERFRRKAVWEGIVHIFDLDGNRDAKRAYAWSSPIEGGNQRQIAAALHIGLVRSPVDAIRAALVAEYRSRRSCG